jgi:hypothetical protein
MARIKTAAATIVGLAGIAALVMGAAILHPALGWIVAGAAALFLSWRLADTVRPDGES